MAELHKLTTVNRNWTCLGCVVATVEAWSGEKVKDLNSVLKDLYFPQHGACDRGALKQLADAVNANSCGRPVNADDLSCAWTVSRLIRETCGA